MRSGNDCIDRSISSQIAHDLKHQILLLKAHKNLLKLVWNSICAEGASNKGDSPSVLFHNRVKSSSRSRRGVSNASVLQAIGILHFDGHICSLRASIKSMIVCRRDDIKTRGLDISDQVRMVIEHGKTRVHRVVKHKAWISCGTAGAQETLCSWTFLVSIENVSLLEDGEYISPQRNKRALARCSSLKGTLTKEVFNSHKKLNCCFLP